MMKHLALAAALVIAFSWVAHSGAISDADSDGVSARNDNCELVANQGQCDADRDGYGDRCDGDYNNDMIVGGPDFLDFKSNFPWDPNPATDPPVPPQWKYDHNGDGKVNTEDFTTFSSLFSLSVGQSGLSCAGDPTSFPCDSPGGYGNWWFCERGEGTAWAP